MFGRIIFALLFMPFLCAMAKADSLYIPSTKEEVIAFWNVERELLQQNRIGLELKIAGNLIDTYVFLIFGSARSTNDVKKLVRFYKYSDAAAENLVSPLVKLMIERPKLFLKTYNSFVEDEKDKIKSIFDPGYLPKQDFDKLQNIYKGTPLVP